MLLLPELKFYGTIGSEFGSKSLNLKIEELDKPILVEVLKFLQKQFTSHFFNFFDPDFTPKRGTIILINGVDFNTLEGLNTEISTSDQIVFIPTISGG